MMKQTVENHLEAHGIAGLEVSPILVFTNPGNHVETQRPVVRVILADGIDRLVTSIGSGSIALETEDVKTLVDIFYKPPDAVEVVDDNVVFDQFALRDEEKKAAPKTPKAPRDSIRPPIDDEKITRNLVSLSNKVGLTRGQWIILGVMLMIAILLFVAAIILMFFLAV